MSDDSHKTDLSRATEPAEHEGSATNTGGELDSSDRSSRSRRASSGRVARSTAGRVSRTETEESSRNRSRRSGSSTRSRQDSRTNRTGRRSSNRINYSVVEFVETDDFSPVVTDSQSPEVGAEQHVEQALPIGRYAFDEVAAERDIAFAEAIASDVELDVGIDKGAEVGTESDDSYSSDELASILSSLLSGSKIDMPERLNRREERLSEAETDAFWAGTQHDYADEHAEPLGFGSELLFDELQYETSYIGDFEPLTEAGSGWPSFVGEVQDAEAVHGGDMRSVRGTEPGEELGEFALAQEEALVEPRPRRSLGIGWSDYYSQRDLEDADSEWLDDIEEDWYDLEEYYLDDDEDERPILIWPLVLTAFAILIVLTGVLTLYIRTTEVRLQAVAQQKYEDAVSTLMEALAFVQEADAVLVVMDKALDSQVTADSVPELESLIVQATGAILILDSAIAKAEEAMPMFDDIEGQEAAQNTIDDAIYKKQMLAFGILLIQADIDAMNCALELDAAWEAILAADSLMREAVSTITSGGTTQITRARDLNQEALVKLDEAYDALVRASATFPEVDFSTLFSYLAAKKESCELAIASDDALLDRDFNTATDLNNQFRAKDAEVVELALLIPDDPLSLIIDAYNERIMDSFDEYSRLHDKVVDVDAMLREWRENNGHR